MARAATTTDAFNAIAEPRRRQLLELLASGELPVHELVARLGLPQPVVSKHLRVLREVGLVDTRSDGRERLYRVNAMPLEPIHDWVGSFARMWNERFDALELVLDAMNRMENPHAKSAQSNRDAAQ